MKVAVYTRISTDKQTDDSQLNELRAYCERRGWKSVQEFRDVISGAKFTRRGLDSMMGLVRKGKLQVVVTYKLDRLGRSLAHLAMLISEMTANDVALVCTSQGIDTSAGSAVGRLQLGVLMAVAEFEREVIRERVNAGLAAARERGQKLGRPGTLEARKAEVQALIDQGHGTCEIARRLSMPPSSVSKLVKMIRIAAA